jgi:hypothetical protein
MLKKTLIIIIALWASLWFVINRDVIFTESKSVLSWVTTKPQIKETLITPTDIIEATNKERVAVGLPPLSTNLDLNESAELKVFDMIDRQYFEHQSPTGEGVSDLGKKAGYDYVIMGENLALGEFTDSADVVRAWMNSPGHKANILNTKYLDIGVSVKKDLYEGKEVWFAVQHFGTSRVVCPAIDEYLKREIDSINNDLRQEERVIGELKKTLEAPGAQNDPAYQNNIKIFNTSVDEYNKKLSLSRQKIDYYNIEVRNFNKCIATFQ